MLSVEACAHAICICSVCTLPFRARDIFLCHIALLTQPAESRISLQCLWKVKKWGKMRIKWWQEGEREKRWDRQKHMSSLHERESWREKESKQLGWEGHGIHISYIKDKHFISIFSEHREDLFEQSELCWGRKSANSLCPCISESIYTAICNRCMTLHVWISNLIPGNTRTFFTLIGYPRLKDSWLLDAQGLSLPLKCVLIRVEEWPSRTIKGTFLVYVQVKHNQ